MDLSKIPEPSESDIGLCAVLANLDLICRNHAMGTVEFYTTIAARKHIAHLLRHGRVLTQNIDIEMVDSEQLGSVMVAIEFFEQFGGNDER